MRRGKYPKPLFCRVYTIYPVCIIEYRIIDCTMGCMNGHEGKRVYTSLCVQKKLVHGARKLKRVFNCFGTGKILVRWFFEKRSDIGETDF